MLCHCEGFPAIIDAIVNWWSAWKYPGNNIKYTNKEGINNIKNTIRDVLYFLIIFIVNYYTSLSIP